MTDPEQLSVELLPQISGFPTILITTMKRRSEENNKKLTTTRTHTEKKTKRERERKGEYLKVLAGNFGTGPLRLL